MLQATFSKVKNKFLVELKSVSSYSTSVSLEKTTNGEWGSAKPFESLPGPSKYQLLRAYMPGGKFYKKSFLDFNNHLRAEYGDIFLVPGLFGKRNIVFTYNPKDFQEVFHTEGLQPVRRGLDIVQYYRNEFRNDNFKNAVGLVAAQGECWSKFRSAVNPIMMNPKAMKIYIPKMDQIASRFVECIKRIRNANNFEVPDNFEEYINFLTMDSVGLIALDTDLKMIENSEAHPKIKTIIENMEEFFQLLLELDIQPSMWKIIPTPKFKKIIRIMDLMNEAALEYVKAAMEKLEKSDGSRTDSDKSILERLISKDPAIATTMVIDMFMAGVDTTTSALAACLLCLAKNPDSQKHLQQELLHALPDKNTALTKENMNNLPFLRASIKEAMRLHPTATGNFRTTGQNIVLSGYRIPNNTDIAMTAQLLLKDPKYFSNPQEYVPQRWLRSNNGTKPSVANPFVYLPFGFGPRICIGKRIVDLELETVLARLLRNFEIRFDYSTDNMFKTSIINVPAKPLRFKFIDLKY